MITKIPIHVQASQELSLLEQEKPGKLAPMSGMIRKPNPFVSNAYALSSNFTGTQVKEGGGKTQFRIRPQTPKLDMILLKKTQRRQLTKIEPLPAKKVKIKKPANKIQMRKIKIKRKESTEKADKRADQTETSDTPAPAVVQTQQNFYDQKLDVRLEEKLKNEYSDEDAILEPEKRQETGVLFGAAYENTYIDILENEGVQDSTEINERLLEISLGMDRQELRELEKIEIVVDTTNTHMQHVGEVLVNLRSLKLNDSVIPSIRDLGTSFK